MLKADKKVLVENLGKTLQTAKSVILVNYQGLTVKSQQELKNRLEAVDAKMIVVKNTLLKIAADNAKLDSQAFNNEVLQGQTALVLAFGDSVAPVQVIGKFAKEFELPKFKVGIVDGNFSDSEGLKTISTLPSKEVLYSQVLGSLMSPMYGLTGTLEGNLQKLVYIIKTKSGGEN